jgi:hypothetical protein
MDRTPNPFASRLADPRAVHFDMTSTFLLRATRALVRRRSSWSYMLRPRFGVLFALALGALTACHQESLDKRMVGIWQFSSMDATMDYVFKADHTFELWAPSMDVEQSKGPWLNMDFGKWHTEKDELIIEYKRPRSQSLEEFLKSKGYSLDSVTRSRVIHFDADKIEFEDGGLFIRAYARRGI